MRASGAPSSASKPGAVMETMAVATPAASMSSIETRGVHAMIAAPEGRRGAPGGYTLLMTALSRNVNATLPADKKPSDPIQDSPTVGLVSFLPLVMVTKGAAPFNSVDDIVKAAGAKPS